MSISTAATEAIAKLTPMGRAFMTQVGEAGFDFFDGGIVEGEGNYGENLAWQMKCAKSPRSAGGIMAGTLKLGMWTVFDSDGQSWWSLTEIGAEVANELAAR